MTKEPDVGLGNGPGSELDEMNPAAFKAQQEAALKAATQQNQAQSQNLQANVSQPQQLIVQAPAKRSGIWTFLLVFFGIFGTAAALVGGFIYGEYYGRHHSQFDNPALRNHYAGECYRYMSQQFTKTMRESFDKEFHRRNELAAKSGQLLTASPELQEIHNLLLSMQNDMDSLRAAIKDGSSTAGKEPAVVRDVQRLIKLLEQNQIKMVADQCPASPNVPRRYSSRAG